MFSTLSTNGPTKVQKAASSQFRKKMHTCSFQQFYSNRSKSFSIIQNIKQAKTAHTNFIDKDFIDAIDEKTPKKHMTQFIKRKMPISTKMQTQQIQVLKDPQRQQNKQNLKVFSNVFNRQRNKVLSKFQTSKQMRETVFKKLGMKKVSFKPFFDMQRGHIFSFQDRYLDVFRQYNSRQNNKSSNKVNINTHKNMNGNRKNVKKVHPLCDIYEKQANRVIRNYSFQKKNSKIDYQPFGKIDYSAHYF